MKLTLQSLRQSASAFVQEEDGAQVIEYALIIAVVSIALVLALQGLTTGNYFQDFIQRVADCLQGAGDCAAPAAEPPAGG